jgi:hypothetical protein
MTLEKQHLFPLVRQTTGHIQPQKAATACNQNHDLPLSVIVLIRF